MSQDLMQYRNKSDEQQYSWKIYGYKNKTDDSIYFRHYEFNCKYDIRKSL